MIVFRKEQLEAFAAAADVDLERALLRRLCEAFPRALAGYGEPVLKALIRSGLARSRKLGATEEDDHLRYVAIMLLLGSDFERDPQLRFAASTLAMSVGAKATERIAMLSAQAREYCNRVMGADNRFQLMAWRAIEDRSLESLTTVASRSSRDLTMQLATLHPQKVQEIGEAALHDVTRVAVEACRTHEILDRESVAFMATLMFLFGVGVMTDPLTAWAPAALKAVSIRDTTAKLTSLLAAASAAAARLTR